MLIRRRRPLMRAAMVGGVAYHAGKQVQQGRDEDVDQSEQSAPAPPAAGGMTDDTIDALGKLGQLHEQGVLTDAEFDQQKQKLLASS
jgi:putative oligomerization/nucleic acid binding protein